MKYYKFLILLCFFYSVSKAQNTYDKYPSVKNIPFSILDNYAYENNNIKNIIKNVALYQIDQYGDHIPKKNWLVGTFFSSFVAAYHVTGEQWYLDEAYKWGKASEWDIHKPINADDVCPGQTYLDIYFIKKDPEIYKTLDKKLSSYFDRKEILPGEKDKYQKEPLKLTGRNIWSWCDALYMAPPVYARLGKATGDSRYYETLHSLYWDAVDFLYAPDEGLFHRNSKEATEKERTPNGKKVYWGRGNGWVLAGLARLIEYLPEDDPYKDKYIQLFKELSYSLAKYQMEDGLWRSSVNDPDWIKTKETSGSAFYVYGIAKGINEGWLPKDYFINTVLKGWTGLMSSVTPYGKLGYTQVVAGSPHEVRPHDNVDFAAGAFILAGTEMLKINAIDEMKKITSSNFVPRVVVEDGFWPTSSDDAVINHRNCYFTSYIKHNGTGAITAFNTKKPPNVSAYARKEIELFSENMGNQMVTPVILPLHKDTIQVVYKGNNSNIRSQDIFLPIWSTMVKKDLKELNEASEKLDNKWNPENYFKKNNPKLNKLLKDSDSIFSIKKKKNGIQVAYGSVNDNQFKYYLGNLNEKNKWEKELLCSFSIDHKKKMITKGITIHPTENVIVLSSPVNPENGQPLPNNSYQLFKGEKTNNKWQWKQLTFDPVYNQLNPIITNSPDSALFWMSGWKTDESKYHTDIMMSSKF